MNEYIKKEDAITALEEWAVNLINPKFIVKEDAICELKCIPSADVVEVKHGKWVKATDDGVWSYADAYAECDQCHKVTFNGWGMSFCPNCGAKMNGKEQKYE